MQPYDPNWQNAQPHESYPDPSAPPPPSNPYGGADPYSNYGAGADPYSNYGSQPVGGTDPYSNYSPQPNLAASYPYNPPVGSFGSVVQPKRRSPWLGCTF